MTVWDRFCSDNKELGHLTEVSAVLAWDQQVMMPPKSAPHRAETISVMSKLLHERSTSSARGDLIEELEASSELTAIQRRAVSVARTNFDRYSKLPAELVGRIAELEGAGFAAWSKAKEAQDFSIFEPVLTDLLDAFRSKASALNPEGDAHETLIDILDPGEKVADLSSMFDRLQGELVPLLAAIKEQPQFAELDGDFPKRAQLELSDEVLRQMGYDFNTGRLDLSAHPFTISMHHKDVRVTTRVDERNFLSGLGGTIHEGGHALYEQGLPAGLKNTGLDIAASMGLHESQSRFWENMIGRSEPFLQWLNGPLSKHLHTNLQLSELVKMANRVKPTPIRVEADEVTYNLHIIIRFRLESAMLRGDLKVSDLPAAWNDAYTKSLGITPENDAEGVLQDVHWSAGLFGYFQSYTLGNLYAASFDSAMRAQLPNLDESLRRGELAEPLSWLRENVHQRGFEVPANQIVADAVGEQDHVTNFINHLKGRHGRLYGLNLL